MAFPWTKKYEPSTTDNIIGQPKAINKLKETVKENKNVLLYGDPGTGKTSSVHALANEMGYEIIEINASDFRNKDKIESVVGNALKQRSLFGGSKIILVDEMDGLSGQKDRGGASEIAKLLTKSAFPIIMTANNPWEKKFNTIRKKAEMVQFRSLNINTVVNVLKRICENEGIEYDERTLKTFARRTGPDLRGAINDLQTLTQDNKLTKESLDELNERKKTDSIMSALMKILKTTDTKVALGALDNVDEDYDKCMLWIDENLPLEYTKPEDLSRAYLKLSKADMFNRRIRKRQYWRFLVYINSLLTAGIATAKDEKYKGFVKYRPTQRLLKLWRANMKYKKRTAIAEKIAEKTHSSTNDIIKDSLPFIRNFVEDVSEYLELNDDELEWLRKTA